MASTMRFDRWEDTLGNSVNMTQVSGGSGLVPVIPSSVTVGSGTATTSANGRITFTGVSSLSLNNIFTSAYTRYHINLVPISDTAGAGVDFWGKFRLSGADISTVYHGSSIYNAYNTSVTNSAQVNAGSAGYVGYIGGLNLGNMSTMEVIPQAGYSGWSFHCRNTNAASQHIGGYSGQTVTSPDGFTIYPATGTMTGTIQVYGYR